MLMWRTFESGIAGSSDWVPLNDGREKFGIEIPEIEQKLDLYAPCNRATVYLHGQKKLVSVMFSDSPRARVAFRATAKQQSILGFWDILTFAAIFVVTPWLQSDDIDGHLESELLVLPSWESVRKRPASARSPIACDPLPIPSFNCSLYERKLIAHSAIVTSEILANFPDETTRAAAINAAILNFCPSDEYSAEVRQTLSNQIFLALQCNRLWILKPPLFDQWLNYFTETMLPQLRKQYQRINPACSEVFLFHHGLRRLRDNQKKRIKSRSILDIGAFNGDSALVLSQYGSDVWSFELSAPNIAMMREVFSWNPSYVRNVHIVHAAVSSISGTMNAKMGIGPDAHLELARGGGVPVRLVTVDEFVKEKGIVVGFIKADVEGSGLAVATGAIETLKRDRPVLAFACYHSFDEIFGVSKFLSEQLTDYHFEWHMENGMDFSWFELGFFGWPRGVEVDENSQ
jgi:FkbM family methyltransferase